MDAGTADTINRRTAQRTAEYLDLNDFLAGLTGDPWHDGPMAQTLMGENPASNADRAWLVGALATKTPGLDFDGTPADADWENLFTHFRAEILARRDPQTSPVHANESVRDGVGSR